MKAAIVLLLGLFAPAAFSAPSNSTDQSMRVWVHLMPWFETRQTSPDGNWGIHWTMANQNPDIVDGNGRRQIAAHYYPADDVYGSGDDAVVDRQINQFVYGGIDGVLIDWPGTIQAWDYPKNLQNAERMINKLQERGIEFAIVYEDHNVGMAYDAGFIGDKLGAGRADMSYLQNNYFNRPNYIKIDGRPLLLDFGPQTFKDPGEWDNLFSVLDPKPQFYTLWYQMAEAGSNSVGEYAWIYEDFVTGLNHFYQFHTAPQKIAVAYPGFNTFYAQGGWPGPSFSIPVSLDTFRQTVELARSTGMQRIQIATWNDYGEGTMIEPTREFGNGFLEILQGVFRPQFTPSVFDTISQLYRKRVAYREQKLDESLLDQVQQALTDLQPEKAAELLATL